MREIQKIRPDGWQELEELEQRWEALERRAGYPDTKRRYRAYSAADDTNTLVIEIEWDSLAAMEAANEKLAQDPEMDELVAATDPVVQSIRMEFYTVLS